MIEIKKIALSKLLKLEVPELIGQTVQILSSHNPEKLHLDGMYGILLDQKTEVEQLMDPYGPHPLTETLNELHAKRLSYATLIVSKLQNLDKKHFRETLNSVQTARPLTNFHLAYLGQKKRNTVHQSILAFFVELDEQPPINEALVSLGLQPYLDGLKQANMEHEKVWIERLRDKAKRPEVDTRQVMRRAQKVLRWLFDQVDSCQSIYNDIDYTQLISELNTVLSKYSRNINMRNTVNKRKKNKAIEAKEKASASEANAKEIELDAQPKAIDTR